MGLKKKRGVELKSKARGELKSTPKAVSGLSHDIDVNSILHELPDIFFAIDLRGIIIRWNRSGEIITGYSASEILHNSAFHFFPASEHKKLREAIRQMIAGGTHRLDTIMQRKDGSVFPCQIRGTVLKDSKGEPSGIAGIIRDMTGSEQAEKELRASEAKFRLLAEQTNALVFTTDARGRVTYANEATSKVLGTSTDDLLGSFYLNFVHKDERERLHQALLKQIKLQLPGHLQEIRFRDVLGHEGWLNIVVDPIVENGVVTGMRGLAIESTEKKKWEAALKRSEERLRSIIDHSPLGIYQSTMEGKFISVNPRLAEMLGYSSLDDVMKLDLASDVYFHSGDRVKAIQQFMADGMKGDVELQWKKRDGSPFWVSLSTHAVLNDRGEIQYFEGFVRDITERKKAQLELLRNEEYYRSLIENSADVTVLVDREGTLTHVSSSSRNVLGFEPEKLVGKSLESLFVEEDQNDVHHSFRRARSVPRETVRMQVRANHADGQYRFVEATAHNMLHHPAVRGIIMNFHDVTERVEAEGRLKESEHKYRQLVEQASDGIFIGDREGRFLLVNEKGRQMLGYSSEEISGMAISDTYAEDERASAAGRHMTLIKEGALSFERKMKRKDRSVFTAEISIKVLSDGNFQGIVRDVTERNKAEQALRDSEEKFRSLAEESPNMIFINHRGRVVYANKRSEEIMGYSKEEFYAKDFDFRTLIDPESLPVVEKNFKAHLQGEEIGPYEYALRTKNGDKIFGLHSTRIVSFEGQPAILGIITDVTETRKSEETQKKLLTAVEQSKDVVFMTDVEGHIQYINPAFEKTYGFSREEVIGKTPRVLKSGMYATDFYSRFWDTLLKRDNVRGELVNKTKDGRLVNMEVSVTPVLGQQSEILGFLAVQTDITERKKTEQKIFEQSTLLDNATDGIVVVNSEGKITFWNKGAERMFGWNTEEAVDKTLAKLIEIGHMENFEAFKQTLDMGSWEGEIESFTKDKRSIIIQSRWTLMRGESERPRSILIVNSDVTEKKVLQKQFYRSQRLDSLGTLAGGIAHDLNNVLAPILLSFEVLSRHVTDESGKRMLKTAHESANRGKQIVSQVLTFARGIEGKKGAVQVRHLLDEIVNIVRETFPKSIEVQNEVPKNLWPIMADATQMHQVMMNLVVNARDAMPQGGALMLKAENRELDESFCRTQLRAHPGRYVVMSVQDSGVGIPQNILDRIFDPFFTTKEMGKGTGLGLSTVHTIVNSHDGFVDVESAIGEGSTFRIYIPAIVDESEKQRKRNALSPMTAHGEWILVIDDEKPIREITEQVLTQKGYNVLTASDGVEAVALFAERGGRFDLVLTDLMMPLMDGVATIRAIRRIRPEIKIIAMSGMLVDETAMQAKDLSPNAFLVKPFSSDVLMEAITQVMNNS